MRPKGMSVYIKSAAWYDKRTKAVCASEAREPVNAMRSHEIVHHWGKNSGSAPVYYNTIVIILLYTIVIILCIIYNTNSCVNCTKYTTIVIYTVLK